MIANKDSDLNKIRLGVFLIAVHFLLTPLDFYPIFSGISIVRILSVIPISGCLLQIPNQKIKFNKYIIILLFYFLLILLSSLYSVDIHKTYSRALSVGSNILFIIILTTIDYNEKEIFFLKRIMVFSGWLVLALILIFSSYELTEGRLTLHMRGAAQDPNYLVGYLMFTFVYYFNGLITRKRWINIIYIGIILYIILMTGSRGGIIAIIGSVAFCFFLWLKSNRIKPKTISIMALAFVSITITIIYIFRYLPEAIVNRFYISYTIKDRGANRFDIWISIVNNYKNFPFFNLIFGQGAGTILNFTNGNAGHNLWLEHLLELGFIGLFILIVMYLVFFAKILHLKENVVTSVFLGYILLTMSLSLYSYKPIWNIIIIILIHNNYYDRKHILPKNLDEQQLMHMTN